MEICTQATSKLPFTKLQAGEASSSFHGFFSGNILWRESDGPLGVWLLRKVFRSLQFMLVWFEVQLVLLDCGLVIAALLLLLA